MPGIRLALLKGGGIKKGVARMPPLAKRGEMGKVISMDQQNVVNLAEAREERERSRTQEEYTHYLKTLGISQLEGEAQFLLEVFSGQNFGSDYAQKVQLLLGELAHRADDGFRLAIQRLGTQVSQDL